MAVQCARCGAWVVHRYCGPEAETVHRCHVCGTDHFQQDGAWFVSHADRGCCRYFFSGVFFLIAALACLVFLQSLVPVVACLAFSACFVLVAVKNRCFNKELEKRLADCAECADAKSTTSS